jgi:hypothetical protein
MRAEPGWVRCGGLVLATFVALGGCATSDDQGSDAGADETQVEMGVEIDAGGASATVLALESAVEPAAEAFAAAGAYVGAEIVVCGDAEQIAAPWTLRVDGVEQEPAPLPPSAVGEDHQPVLDFTAGPEEDGCRTGWVFWDVSDDAEGQLLWDLDDSVAWSAAG